MQDRGSVDRLDGVPGGIPSARQLNNAELRNREPHTGRVHDQRGHDRKGQWNPDDKRGAPGRCRCKFHGAANRHDIAANHIHADAAAGNLAHRIRGRKAGLENEIADFGIAQSIELHGRSQTLGKRLAPHGLNVETLAVVGYFDDDTAPLLRCPEADPAGCRLAGLGAPARVFQAMIGGIAHHMRQRILDRFEDLPVELLVSARHPDLDRLAKIGSERAHEDRQFLPRVGNGLQSRLHDRVLEFDRHGGQSLQRRGEGRHVRAGRDIEQLIAGKHEFAHRCHQCFQGIDGDPNRLDAQQGRLRLRICRRDLQPVRIRIDGVECVRDLRWPARLDRFRRGVRLLPGPFQGIEMFVNRRSRHRRLHLELRRCLKLHAVVRVPRARRYFVLLGRNVFLGQRVLLGQSLEPLDKIVVGALRFPAVELEFRQDLLEPFELARITVTPCADTDAPSR